MNIKKEKKMKMLWLSLMFIYQCHNTHTGKKKTEKRNSQKIKYNKVNEK